MVCPNCFLQICDLTNRVMTLFTSLGPSADCRGPTQITTYQGRTDNARVAAWLAPRLLVECVFQLHLSPPYIFALPEGFSRHMLVDTPSLSEIRVIHVLVDQFTLLGEQCLVIGGR